MDGITVLSILICLAMVGFVGFTGISAWQDPLTKVDMGCLAPLLLLFGVGIFLFSSLRKSWEPWKRTAAYAFLGLEILALLGYIVISAQTASARSPKLAVIAAARNSGICAGQAIQNTRPYAPDAKQFHPLVILGNAWKGRADAGPAYENKMAWVPDQITDLELAACLEAEATTIKMCEYAAASIPAYQHRLTIRIYAAASGELIAERVFQGELPPECPESVKVNMDTGNLDPPYVIGTVAPFPEDWLSQFVGQVE